MPSLHKNTFIALVALAVTAGGGYWYMRKPSAAGGQVASGNLAAPKAAAPGAGAPGAGAPAPGGAPPGPPRAMGVELAVVETSSLRDDAQTIGTLKSRQNTIVRPEVAGRVVDRCIQILGGMGVAQELPLERWYREMRIKRIGEGPSEVHRMVVARDMLGTKRQA